MLLGRFITDTGDPQPADIDFETVSRWWGGLDGLAPATRAAYHSVIRLFLDHLVTLGVLDANPMRSIVRPKIHDAPPVVLSEIEVHAVISAARTPVDRAIITLMHTLAPR